VELPHGLHRTLLSVSASHTTIYQESGKWRRSDRGVGRSPRPAGSKGAHSAHPEAQCRCKAGPATGSCHQSCSAAECAPELGIEQPLTAGQQRQIRLRSHAGNGHQADGLNIQPAKMHQADHCGHTGGWIIGAGCYLVYSISLQRVSELSKDTSNPRCSDAT